MHRRSSILLNLAAFFQYKAMDSKLNVAILAGGNSSEAEISLRGAAQVAGWLDVSRFNVYTILIAGQRWTLQIPGQDSIPVDKNDFSAQVAGKKVHFHCALMLIHGTPGENGLLQGYLELMGVPHTTCNTLSAAATFNKFICKELVRATGVNLARDMVVKKGQTVDTQQVIKTLGLPLFVKPNASGSSYGVTKVKTADELLPAIQCAMTEDDTVLIEEFIPGREFSCGVFKTATAKMLMPVTEIITQTEYFDYDAKYNHKSSEVTPAQIPDTLAHSMQHFASKIYDRLLCRGIVRVDYIVHADRPYFLEINTVPGMSAESIIPQQVRAMGGNMRDLFTQIIDDAMTRQNR